MKVEPRRRRSRARGRAEWRVLAVAAAIGLAWAAAGTGAATARPAPCSSYDRPGTTATGRAPADVAAEYGVLRRARRSTDRLALASAGPLDVSAISTTGIRRAGRAADGTRFYLIPAAHVLAVPLAPPRCVPPGQRAARAALLGSARHTYPRHGLCLVALPAAGTPAGQCGPAPGDLGTLLASGTDLFGLVPDGVSAVSLAYYGSPPATIPVHENLWQGSLSATAPGPCGLSWLAASGTVLRTLSQCIVEDD